MFDTRCARIIRLMSIVQYKTTRIPYGFIFYHSLFACFSPTFSINVTYHTMLLCLLRLLHQFQWMKLYMYIAIGNKKKLGVRIDLSRQSIERANLFLAKKTIFFFIIKKKLYYKIIFCGYKTNSNTVQFCIENFNLDFERCRTANVYYKYISSANIGSTVTNNAAYMTLIIYIIINNIRAGPLNKHIFLIIIKLIFVLVLQR